MDLWLYLGELPPPEGPHFSFLGVGAFWGRGIGKCVFGVEVEFLQVFKNF